VVPRRRRSRAPEPAVDPEEGMSVRELAARHLLLVPTTVDMWMVDALLRDRVPGADLLGTGEVVFGRYSRLTGPYELTMEDAVDAGVPMPWTVCYCLEAPVEREDPPLEGVDDRDGFAYAFPDGLPWRDEGRVLHLLVSIARRIQGAVRVAGSLQVIMPDPDRAVDYVVHTPTLLEPEVLLGVVTRELPGARLAIDGVEWHGPPDEAYTGELVAEDLADDPLSPAQQEALHTHADEVDMASLAGPDVIDAFAISGDLGWDGTIEVLCHLPDGEEPAIADEPWADGDFATYEVRWTPPDLAERERRYPSEVFLASRARVKPLIAAVTRAIIEATDGVIVDEDGFRIDRYDL
jgi:hypothetical protein